jgi:hypothetical protein
MSALGGGGRGEKVKGERRGGEEESHVKRKSHTSYLVQHFESA